MGDHLNYNLTIYPDRADAGGRMTSEAASYFLDSVGGESKTASAEAQATHFSVEGPPRKVDSVSDIQRDLAECPRLLVSLSDDVLFELLRQGDKEALGVLFRRYARMVRAVAFRILRNGAEADDLLQEVFLFIFRKWALFDAARGSARSWIVQVTYHRAIDRRRHLASRHFYTNSELSDTSLAIDQAPLETSFYELSIEGSLGIEMLRRINEVLSSDQRKTMQLYFFEGYTFEEIAELGGHTVGNVRNHYYRGLERIRKLIFAAKLREK